MKTPDFPPGANFDEISLPGAKLLEVLADLVLGFPLGFVVFAVSPGGPPGNRRNFNKFRFFDDFLTILPILRHDPGFKWNSLPGRLYKGLNGGLYREVLRSFF
jgi:hypothetical protein